MTALWPRRLGWTATLLILTGAVIVTTLLILEGTVSFGGWKTISGIRETDGSATSFELHYSGGEAILIERQNGAVTYDARCSGTEFTERFFDPPDTIVRNGLSPGECFRFATGSLLGSAQVRTLETYQFKGPTTVAGRPAEVWSQRTDAGIRAVLDTATGLPLEATGPDGATVVWRYSKMDVVSVEPLPTAQADEGSPSVESYQTLPRGQLASVFKVAELPDRIAGLEYETGFSYLGGQLSTPTFYAVWSDGAGRQVQAILAAVAIPPDASLVEDDGRVASLNLREGESHLQIIATDRALLVEAVRLLRPQELPKLSTSGQP